MLAIDFSTMATTIRSTLLKARPDIRDLCLVTARKYDTGVLGCTSVSGGRRWADALTDVEDQLETRGPKGASERSTLRDLRRHIESAVWP